MVKILKKIGNSHMITLDKAIIEQMGVLEGSQINVTVRGHNVVLAPVQKEIPEEDFEGIARRVMDENRKVLSRLA